MDELTTRAYRSLGQVGTQRPPLPPTGFDMKLDPDVISRTLDPLITSLAGRPPLTPAERLEAVRIAQGFACKDSAAAVNVSPETIRARRKRIYRKLGVPSANNLIAELLAISLRLLGRGENVAAPRSQDATKPSLETANTL